MTYQTPANNPADENYEQAVQRAGVIELPDNGGTQPTGDQLTGDQPTDLLAGRFEGANRPGVPR